MPTKANLLNILFVIVSLVLAALAIVSFQNSRKMDLEFNEKKAILVKENLDLKDRVDSLKEIVKQKTGSVEALEKEKGSLEIRLEVIKKENEQLKESYSQELKTLRRQKVTLRKRLLSLEEASGLERVKEAFEKEENENIKNVLKYVMEKIELIQAGQYVSLEPIVVTKKADAAASGTAVWQEKEKIEGVVLSVEKEDGLIIINLGRRDNVKEGDRLNVLKDGDEIARGEVVNVRYRISAAFIDDISPGYKIDVIKENYQVIMAERR